ncbi:hypothetical protein D9M69_634250 [compost metagenome]
MHGSESLAQFGRQARGAQQVVHLRMRRGQHHAVETTHDLLTTGAVFGAQLPLFGVKCVAFDLGHTGVEQRGGGQGLGPQAHQGVHAG